MLKNMRMINGGKSSFLKRKPTVYVMANYIWIVGLQVKIEPVLMIAPSATDVEQRTFRYGRLELDFNMAGREDLFG